jgi:hypothetical protein
MMKNDVKYRKCGNHELNTSVHLIPSLECSADNADKLLNSV